MCFECFSNCLCGCCVVWITSLSVILVREKCFNIVKIGQVENFVSSLCLNSLLEIGRLWCLVEGPIEKDDENFKGIVNGYSWHEIEMKRNVTLLGCYGIYFDRKEYSLMWELWRELIVDQNNFRILKMYL